MLFSKLSPLWRDMDEAALMWHLYSCAPKEERGRSNHFWFQGGHYGLTWSPPSSGWVMSQCPRAGCSGWCLTQTSPGLERKEQFLKGSQEELWPEKEFEVWWADTATKDPLPVYFPSDSRRAGVLVRCVEYIRLHVRSCDCKKSLGQYTIFHSELHITISHLIIFSAFGIELFGMKIWRGKWHLQRLTA